jgi:hypothetical protein
MATSVFEAFAKTKEFVEASFWKGPKPTPQTMFKVNLVADDRTFWVPAAALDKWERPRVQGCR